MRPLPPRPRPSSVPVDFPSLVLPVLSRAPQCGGRLHNLDRAVHVRPEAQELRARFESCNPLHISLLPAPCSLLPAPCSAAQQQLCLEPHPKPQHDSVLGHVPGELAGAAAVGVVPSDGAVAEDHRGGMMEQAEVVADDCGDRPAGNRRRTVGARRDGFRRGGRTARRRRRIIRRERRAGLSRDDDRGSHQGQGDHRDCEHGASRVASGG